MSLCNSRPNSRPSGTTKHAIRYSSRRDVTNTRTLHGKLAIRTRWCDQPKLRYEQHRRTKPWGPSLNGRLRLSIESIGWSWMHKAAVSWKAPQWLRWLRWLRLIHHNHSQSPFHIKQRISPGFHKHSKSHIPLPALSLPCPCNRTCEFWELLKRFTTSCSLSGDSWGATRW